MPWKLWAYRDIRIFICMYLHKGYAWNLGKKTVPHIRIILAGLGVWGRNMRRRLWAYRDIYSYVCIYIRGMLGAWGRKRYPK